MRYPLYLLIEVTDSFNNHFVPNHTKMKLVRRWFASAPGKPMRVDYVAINKTIQQCSSAKEVDSLVMRNPIWNDVNLSTAVRSMMKNRSTNDAAYNRILELSRTVAFSPRPLSSILHSFASGKQFNEIPQTFVQKMEEIDVTQFSPLDISNTVWAFAKLGSKSPTLFQKFAMEIETRDLDQFNDQTIANICWAFAKLDFKSDELFACFAQNLIGRNLSTSAPQSIANILWAFAKLDDKHYALFDHFAQALLARDLSTFDPQSIANTVWACATIGYKDDELFARFAQDLITRDISTFTPQAIANIVWACATLGYKNNELLVHFAQRLMTRTISTLDPQAVSNTVWALATLDFKNDELFASFAQHLMTRNLSTAKPQEIANILWAFAKLDFKSDQLFARFAQDLMTRDFSTFQPQEIASIVWALAKLNLEHEEVFACFAQHLVTRDLSTFMPQSIANIAWAFAKLRVSAPAVFQCFADAVLSNPQLAPSKMSSQDLSISLYSCALVNYRNDALLNELAHELSLRQSLSLQETVNSMWAFACLDAFDLEQVQQWFSKPNNQQQDTTALVAEAQQLIQVKLAWQQTRGEPFPALIESLCEGGWVDAALLAEKRDVLGSSSEHLRIANMLKQRFTLQNETQLLGGVLVDIFIPGHNAVVEVDGPSHFFSNESDVKTGKTVFKHRLLERAGFKLLSVPFREFAQVDAEQYIKDLEDRITK